MVLMMYVDLCHSLRLKTVLLPLLHHVYNYNECGDSYNYYDS